MDTCWLGLCCLELRPEGELDPDLFRRLAAAAEQVRQDGLAQGATSSYGSLAAYWDDAPADPRAAEAELTRVIELAMARDTGAFAPSTHVVPARYAGPDLAAVAAHCDLDEAEVVARHRAVAYTVAAVGFLPGFAYLWGLDPALETPRLASPRAAVPAGSVGIGGNQTGIYPQASPGGWHLIGVVDAAVVAEVCPQMRVGDTVRFEEVGG